MVCHGTVEITLPKHFWVGTPQKRFPCINLRQFPSTNPTLAHPETSHTTSQALFPSTPADQNFEALSPTSPPTPFLQAPIPAQPTRQTHMQPRKHFSQVRPPIKIAKYFPNLPAHPLLQGPMPAQPIRQTRMQPCKHFSQAPPTMCHVYPARKFLRTELPDLTSYLSIPLYVLVSWYQPVFFPKCCTTPRCSPYGTIM